MDFLVLNIFCDSCCIIVEVGLFFPWVVGVVCFRVLLYTGVGGRVFACIARRCCWSILGVIGCCCWRLPAWFGCLVLLVGWLLVGRCLPLPAVVGGCWLWLVTVCR